MTCTLTVCCLYKRSVGNDAPFKIAVVIEINDPSLFSSDSKEMLVSQVIKTLLVC